MRIGVFARNLFVDWFGGSTRTNRELLIRLAGRRGVEVDFIPVVDEVYWRFRGRPDLKDMVLRWVEAYERLGIYVHGSLIEHYINGDLHKTWAYLSREVLKEYDVVYDPILMPMADPRPLPQVRQVIDSTHYILDYLSINRNGKVIALTIGITDVPLKLMWGFRFVREFLFSNFRRVAGIELFILRSLSLINSLSKYKNNILLLIPSIGVFRKVPQFRKFNYAIFYPAFAIDERVWSVSAEGKDRVAVFFTRLDVTKGILDLPRIIHYMNNKLRCDVVVKVIGGFEDERTEYVFWRRVRELGITKYIDFIGYVPEDKKVDAYREVSRSQVLIYPSHSDAVSNVILEALALRTPVVAYDIPSVKEIFSGTRAVRFVPEFNVKEMAAETCRVMQAGDGIDDEAMRIVKEHSDWQVVINNFLSILSSLGIDE